MAVSIQVDRLELIKSLEKRLKEIPAEHKAYKASVEKYEKDLRAWGIKVMKTEKNIKDVGSNWNGSYITLTLTEAISKTAPKAPENGTYANLYHTESAVKEITETLKVLKLSNAETVGSSITKNIAQYL
jgi:phage shock protein A